MSDTEPEIKVFISYAHADHELHKKLEEHLSSLKYAGEIIIWHDQAIPAGANWQDQIDMYLHEANIILLLVSASFIASENCWNREVGIALERHKAGTALVIPVILKPVRWRDTPLGQLQVLPIGAQPITQWSDQDEALENVARGVQSAVEHIRRTLLQRKTESAPDLPPVQKPPLTEVTHLERAIQSLANSSPATTSVLRHHPSAALSVMQQRFAEGKKIRPRRLALLVLTGLVIVALLASSLVWFIFFRGASVGNITEIAVPTDDSSPQGITTGPDGSLWFTELDKSKIGRISISGKITEFSLLTDAKPNEIVAGPDRNLWFTEDNEGKIGRISTSGAITEFPLPISGSEPWGITAGPDRNLWFAEFDGNKIGCISTSGKITEFSLLTADAKPKGITAGPDGNLWFTEVGGNKIGRINTSGKITEFSLRTDKSQPRRIAVGSDGNLWFTEWNVNKIGRISTSGKITEFPLLTDAKPQGITAGPDGNLWFTEYNGNKIGRISISGEITEFPLPTSGSVPEGITAGPDKNLWFTELYGNRIGRITSGQ